MKKSLYQLGLCAALSLLSTALWAESVPVNQEKVDQVANGTLTEAAASWWGFNEEDSTANLQAALNSGVKKLTIDKMASDWIVCQLEIPSNIEIVLADDVTVRAKPGEFHDKLACLMRISLQENVTIRGGNHSVLLMNKKDYHSDAYEKSEWRHGLTIKSSKNLLIENLTIRATGGDGIYLGVAQTGVPCENVVIRNVFCDDNNRQGISVISAKNLLIEDCNLSNTWGTPPAAGIDFEPNRPDECLVNCVMRRCVLENNQGDGIALYLPNLKAKSEPLSLVIEDCVTRNNKHGFWHSIGNGDELTLAGEMAVRNCRFENDNGGGIRIEGKGIDGHSLIFENCVVDLSAVSTPDKQSPVLILNRPMDQYPAGNMVFNNVTVIDPAGHQPLGYIDQTPFGFGLQQISGTIFAKKSADDAGATVTIDEEWLKENFPPLNRRSIPMTPLHPEKVVPVNPVSAVVPSVLRVRNGGSWYFYAQKGQVFTFAMKQFQVGGSSVDPVTPVLTAPDGKTQNLDPFDKTEKFYKVKADQTGIWTVSANVGNHAFTVTDASVPNAFPCYPQSNLISTTGTFYFYVPEHTEAFAVRFGADDAERLTASVCDPSGKELWRQENISGAALFDAPENPASGVWSVRFEKPTVKIMEDFFVAFFGVAPMLSPDPDKILTEEK